MGGGVRAADVWTPVNKYLGVFLTRGALLGR